MYEFYVLYLHVDLERQWLKCEIILLNLYRQHYWGIQPKNHGIYQMKWFVWLSTQTKYISFGLDFYDFARSRVGRVWRRQQTKRNSLIMSRLGSKSPCCTTWICSCTVWLRTLAISISIAVWFALDPVFILILVLFLFRFYKGILPP